MIHVFLQEGKKMKLLGEPTCRPLVEIESCGIKKITKDLGRDIPCDGDNDEI